ncbi:MAG: type VI secretion protein [Oscillospiraceae bacterium]|nr:type VI secretion protein [Oscillospiraceae bacterium]MBR4132414.1 type VI secretion protein [Oscillospiraceae bacterium]
MKPPGIEPRKKAQEGVPKDFLDVIAPGAVKFNTDHYILGNSYRTAIALRGYPTSTEELALLRHLGDKSGVTLSVYARQVTPAEERKIIHDAANKNRMSRASTTDLKATVTAEANLQDVTTLITTMHRNREPLMHCAVFIELSARDMEGLRTLQNEVMAELVRSKLSADRILLRQQEGFRAVNPAGWNCFGSQYERVLPASSVANLFPFNYSGKTDPHGFYIGKDRYGSNVIVDLDRRAEDKTNGSVLILGNSGEGKSFLLKLLLENLLESGKTAICLDPEHELMDLCQNLGGCFIDLMSGRYIINPLEPKLWDVDGEEDPDAPEAFRKHSRLSQHISFLKDFFRAYKDFSQWHIDTIELMLERLYRKRGLDDGTDFSKLGPTDYPILSDLYAVIEDAYRNYDAESSPLYTRDRLQDVLLGLHSMCVGAESCFFNGHTNITSDRFLVFGVKGLLQGNTNVKDALLFNVLSYLSDRLLTEGNTVAALDELYIWLSSRMTIEYIRNTLKRVRKKESSLIMASQNLEDFNVDGIRELTRPLFAIPTHQFIFHCGAVDKQFYMQNLQLEESEYELIRFPQNGVCLYKCGVERFLLEVHAPEYKRVLFGNAGGR